MWRFILSAIVTIGLVWILSMRLTIGETTLPPLGKFLSPAHGFWQNAENDKYIDNILRLDGLRDEVEIVFDQRSVPYIFAKNDYDLFYAQGYVTAMQRLWQLDISVRASAGRISEVMGDGALNYDLGQRRYANIYGAEQTLKGWSKDPETITIMQAYADGINAYIKKLKPRKYPVEFKLLGYAPEEWTPMKSALFRMSMCNTLCAAEFDLEFSTLRGVLGQEMFDFYFPEYNPTQDPIIPKDVAWDFEPLDAPPVDSGAVMSFPGTIKHDPEGFDPGSNNWALAGSKTKSGNPMLANDPHLNLTLPSIWHEIQLVGPDINVHGAALPGLPNVISGFNETAAWGMTNVNHDVLDWYTVDWIDSEKTKYRIDDQVKEVSYRVEEVTTRSGKVVADTIKYTDWGPVLKGGAYDGLAMRWIALEEPEKSDGIVFYQLNKVNSPEAFMAALDRYHAPAQNFVYADINDNIAMRIGGSLPLRAKGQGRFVSDGSVSSNGWTQYIPAAHNPSVLNPARGFVSSANQRTTGDAYPYYYTGGKYFEDYRGRTLNRFLGALEEANVENMKQLQHSNYSLKAGEALPLLLAAIDSVELTQDQIEIRDILADWDYEYDRDSKGAVLFDRWFWSFFEMTFDEFTELRDSLEVMYPESWRLIDLAGSFPGDTIFDLRDTETREHFEDIARLSFVKMADEYFEAYDGMEWSAYRRLRIGHLGNIPGFQRDLTNAPGHGDALNATSRSNGPSWRMIVELNDPVVAHVVYPGGQSGNPGSKFYDNMVDDWVNGVYHTITMSRDPNDIDKLYSLQLQPRGK